MAEYPLIETAPDQLRTPSGRRLEEMTLDAVLAGDITMEDLRVSAEALELQAQFAEGAGRSQLADNLRRAAELVAVPEQKILEIYNTLRPGRATCDQLLALADEMETAYSAPRCAAMIRESAAIL